MEQKFINETNYEEFLNKYNYFQDFEIINEQYNEETKTLELIINNNSEVKLIFKNVLSYDIDTTYEEWMQRWQIIYDVQNKVYEISDIVLNVKYKELEYEEL